MTRHFDYRPSASVGDNLSEGSSAPLVSRWLWPGNRTFLEVASIVDFCPVTIHGQSWEDMQQVSWIFFHDTWSQGNTVSWNIFSSSRTCRLSNVTSPRVVNLVFVGGHFHLHTGICMCTYGSQGPRAVSLELTGKVTDGLVVREGVSVTWTVLSRSGGHEFEPQSGQTGGAWYFCPKSYLNQKDQFHLLTKICVGIYGYTCTLTSTWIDTTRTHTLKALLYHTWIGR